MKTKYNTLTKNEYIYYIENEKKFNVNILGMYRSLFENEKLTQEDKIEIRDLLNKDHFKTYEFYQISHPNLYAELYQLDNTLNEQEYDQLWENMREFQEKTLKEKKIKHRNFGDYSKHLCGHKDCPLNGQMIKQGSVLAETCMSFKSDKRKEGKKEKSRRYKKDKREFKNKIRKELY